MLIIEIAESAVSLAKRKECGKAISVRDDRWTVNPDNQFVGERESLPISSRSSRRRGGHGTVPEFYLSQR